VHRTFISLALALSLADAETSPIFQPLPERPELQAPAIAEASGLAISTADPRFMWIINDSGGTPDIHLAGTDGSYRGKVTLKDTKNTDWEDLASFSLDGNHYLLVADTGDNQSKRDSCTLHVLREPELPADGRNLAVTAPPAWRIQFRYDGGPRDCEAVAVDAKAGKIIVISKRTQPPEVHELPLRPPAARGIVTARKIGTSEVKSPMASLIPFRDQPTGLDIAADSSLAAVVTYHGVFLFPRKPDENWAQAFAKPPAALPPHLLAQAEAVAFAKDGRAVYAISEGRNSPIVSFQKSAEDSKSQAK
jgi:hypothetical protein